MNVNLKYCTLAAVLAVVLFSVTIGYVMNSGQASYTAAPETWYWSTVHNTTYAVSSGNWILTNEPGAEEGKYLAVTSEATILIAIHAMNPNPTLYFKAVTNTNSGFLLISRDGNVGAAQMANISLYSNPVNYNKVFIIPTNLTAGYSVLNLTSKQNGTQSAAYMSAMWLE